MQKESIICIVIILLILIGNYKTENYASKSINKMSEILGEIKEQLIVKEVNKTEAQKKLNDLDNKWNEVYPRMAYFIEHDELEKVKTSFTVIQSFYETEEYTDAISEIDKSIYILSHIKEKNDFNFKNIF